jgi:hypothetical protein
VIFGELDWRPSILSQAEDRLHRIGQKDNVLVQHLVLQGSLDAHIAKTIIAKQRIIDVALGDKKQIDTSVPEIGPDLDLVGTKGDDIATRKTTRKKVFFDAEKLNKLDTQNIHGMLRMVAKACDHAHAVDMKGFSKIDAEIGHSLANTSCLSVRQAALGLRLCVKYRKQLSALDNERLDKLVKRTGE